MDEIRRQVQRAQHRLIWKQFVVAWTWSLLVISVIVLAAVIVGKIWPLGIDSQVWAIGWVGGGVLLALVTSLIWTWVWRRSPLEAAIELDRRFGLKERVSSLLALPQETLESEAGRALLQDAERHVRRIDVAQRFQAERSWLPLAPILTLCVVFLIVVFVPSASRDKASAKSSPPTKQVKKSVEQLKKRLQQRKRAADKLGLKEAKAVFTKFEKAVDALSQENADRKKALIKLNNLTKDLARSRKSLENASKMRKQLQQLKGMKPGPAQQLARALKSGDMQQGLKELQKLQDKLRSGKLTEQEQKQLAQQLNELQKQIEKMLGLKDELQQQKRALQEKIERLKQQGDRQAAGKLQKKLDQVQKQLDELDRKNPQLKQLEQLAAELSDCCNSLKQGNSGEAADKLAKIAKSLQQMQDEMEQLDSIDQLMDEIADAKNAMNCAECDGDGCAACQGAGFGQKWSDRPGQGMGPGRGYGDRPEEKTETGEYRTRVRAKPRRGEAIRIGDAGGANIAGGSRESVQQEIASQFSKDPDPVVQDRLPRREREQATEYFKSLRDGK